jgi:hypothetical protein
MPKPVKPVAPSEEVKKLLEGIKKEVLSGCPLHVQDDEDKGWNECARRVITILERYKRGEGLFQ